jgi:acetyl/propionyl-CoA carboxylase alpha subunit
MTTLTSEEFHVFAEVFAASDWDDLELLVDGLDLRLRRSALGVTSRLTRAKEPGIVAPVLCAPHLGTFHARVAAGQSVEPGTLLGELTFMARTTAIIAPSAATIIVIHAADGSLVECGEVLIFLDSDVPACGASN